LKNNKQELILSALLTNPTVKQASASIGVPETTIYTWLRKPAFKAEYERRKKELVDNTRSYLQVKLQEATSTIYEIMMNDEVPSQTRLNAARTMFEYCHKLTEQADIIARLDELESQIKDDSGR